MGKLSVKLKNTDTLGKKSKAAFFGKASGRIFIETGEKNEYVTVDTDGSISLTYQEIGRSGRDGQPAEALMFYSFRDVSVYREFIENSDANATFKRVQAEKLDRIWEFMVNQNR